jgi:hypothetical protein
LLSPQKLLYTGFPGIKAIPSKITAIIVKINQSNQFSGDIPDQTVTGQPENL